MRAARRIALSLAASAIALSAGLAAPLSVAARAPCETDTCRLVRDSTSIVFEQYRGADGQFAIFDVIDVLKGPRMGTEWLSASDFSPYSPRGRWIFVAGPDFGTMFRVSASGVVTDLFAGEGEPNDYPTTLAAWYAALAAIPDTATAPVAATPAPPESPVVLLAGAGLLGALLALRRASAPRRGPRVALLGALIAACAAELAHEDATLVERAIRATWGRFLPAG